MQPIEMQGLWWFPETPTEKYSGTLLCSEAGEIRVSVMGRLAETPDSSERTYPTILGEAVDDRKVRQVTLSDCLLTRQTRASDPLGNRQEFFAHLGFFGAHLTNEGDFAFQTAKLSFSGLSAWAHDLTGFIEEEQSFSVSWKHPEHISGGLPGGTFVLGAGCSYSETRREKRLKEEIGLNLTFTGFVREPELQGNIVYPLQNFLTFATDHPNALTQLRVSRQALSTEDIILVGFATFADESQAAEILPLKMLFSLADITGRVEDVIRRWLELSKQYSEVFGIYFGSIYRPPGYSDLSFALMTQVLSLYQARRGQNTNASRMIDELTAQAAKRLPADLTAGLRKVIDSHPLVSAERALVILMQEHQEEFEPLVAGKKGGAQGFVTYALNTVQYTLTRDRPEGHFASQGADLYWLTECIAFLFKISLLKELGFSPDQVHTILDRNPRYKYIRDTIRPQAAWTQ